MDGKKNVLYPEKSHPKNMVVFSPTTLIIIIFIVTYISVRKHAHHILDECLDIILIASFLGAQMFQFRNHGRNSLQTGIHLLLLAL